MTHFTAGAMYSGKFRGLNLYEISKRRHDPGATQRHARKLWALCLFVMLPTRARWLIMKLRLLLIILPLLFT